MQNWQIDNKDSIEAFYAVQHTVVPLLLSGDVHSIEMADNEILLMMDAHSGIDLIRKNEKGLQGVAWRAQWGKAYDSFTIRSKRATGSKTELEKRLQAIEDGYFYPAYTMQAYFDKRGSNNCISCAIVETKLLYRLYLDRPGLFKKRMSNNEFFYIAWDDMPIKVKTWRAHKPAKQLGFKFLNH
jgi:hypothetical protein